MFTDKLVSAFHLSIPQSELDDLQTRLSGILWPELEAVEQDIKGPTNCKIRALIDYWSKARCCS